MRSAAPLWSAVRCGCQNSNGGSDRKRTKPADLVRFLSDIHFELLTQQALAHHPDLVLMDLRLPGAVDGLEAAQFLRTHLNLPVLVIIGVTYVTTLARARQLSPMAVLAKPVADHALQSALEAILTRRPPGDPSPVASDPGGGEMACAEGPRARLTPTILIVEDDAGVQAALAEALRLEAPRLLIVATVQEAEEVLQRLGVATIQLVIADVHFTTSVQAHAGYTLYERWHGQYPQLPFLLISGSPGSRDLPAVRAEAVRFLAKPFALDDLLQATREETRACAGLFLFAGWARGWDLGHFAEGVESEEDGI